MRPSPIYSLAPREESHRGLRMERRALDTRLRHAPTFRSWRVLSNGGAWQAAAFVAAVIVVLPILSIFVIALTPTGDVWRHLFANVLPSALQQTGWLMLGVGLLTASMGAITAWLVTMYRFPGRDALDWLLILPLAIPTYVAAYTYVELMDYAGPLQGAVRWALGVQSVRDYWFPEMRSMEGAIFVMAMVLYPYVYLTARATFLQQSVCVLEVARTLGRSGTGAFWQVGLPMARPAVVVGVALALMECLNDIGAVQYLGVQTLTATIYTTWLERSSLGAAAQISLVMILIVMLLLWVERAARRRRYFHHTTGKYRALPETRLKGAKAWLATFACAMPVLFGFALPLMALAQDTLLHLEQTVSPAFWSAAQHSLLLAVGTALLSVALVVLINFGMRLSHSRSLSIAARLAGVGYAMPGTVIAIGLLVPLAAFDNGVDAVLHETFGISTGLLLSGSAAALIMAHTVRFLAVALGAVESGFHTISPNVDAAARALGARPGRMLRTVHLAMLRPAIGAAALLVFVDSMKELPATLLMRPFNFDTLSTHVYTYASLAMFSEAAPAALMIVLIGLLPVIFLHRAITGGRPGHRRAVKAAIGVPAAESAASVTFSPKPGE